MQGSEVAGKCENVGSKFTAHLLPSSTPPATRSSFDYRAESQSQSALHFNG